MSVLSDAVVALESSGYARIADLLVDELNRKDRALDAGIRALDALSKKGSITRLTRERAMEKLWDARQQTLIPQELPAIRRNEE